MEKVAVFGNAGGGKSTLSKKLSEITGLPLYVLDKIKFQPGGIEVPYEDYKQAHAEILSSDRWIIDGFGCLETLWQRLDAADSLIFVDLSLYMHFLLVTKRFLTGKFDPPLGWPENSPIIQSSINSYQVLWICHERMVPKYRDYIEQAQQTKSVYHLRSLRQVAEFLVAIANQVPATNKD